MRALVDHWMYEYDWRRSEAELNLFPHFVTGIDGIDVHFLLVEGRGPNPRPLLLSHGWPGSVLEFVKLIPLLTEYEKAHIGERQPLPDRYLGLSDREMDERIASARAQLGRRLVILGHHYQRDEVMKFADYTGDSFKLARHVSEPGSRSILGISSSSGLGTPMSG